MQIIFQNYLTAINSVLVLNYGSFEWSFKCIYDILLDKYNFQKTMFQHNKYLFFIIVNLHKYVLIKLLTILYSINFINIIL